MSDRRGMVITMSKDLLSKAAMACSADETQVRRGGWLRLRPRYSLMIRSESRQSSSMIQAS